MKKIRYPKISVSQFFAIATLLVVIVFGLRVSKTNAAANLTISSASIASNGRTMTVNISGVSGSLATSSGTSVLGFTVKLTTGSNVAVVNLGTITLSGSTVTIPLAASMPSGATVKVSLATSPTSNLTDGSSNTPSASGNTSISVTNNSTLNTSVFGINDVNSKIYVYGYGPASTYNSQNDITLTNGGLNDGQLNFGVTGSSTDMQVLGTQTFNVSVDGGGPTAITAQGDVGEFTWVPLFTGLTDTNHHIVITTTTQYPYIEADATIRVTGSSPALYSQATDAKQMIVINAPFATYSALDGSPTTTGASIIIPNSVAWNPGQGNIRFSASTTAIQIYAYDYAGPVQFNLYQDGVFIAGTTGPSNAAALITLANGLDGLSHNYKIVTAASANSGSGVQFNLYSISLAGGGLNQVTQSTVPTFSWYGDSISIEDNPCSVPGYFTGDAFLVGQAVGGRGVEDGAGGTSVSTYLRDNTSRSTSLSPKPKIVLIAGGTNDGALQHATSTFQSDYQSMLTNMAAGLPAGSIMIARAILPTAFYIPGPITRASYNTAIQAAVAAYMAGSPSIPVYYVPTDNWITTVGTGDLCSDPHISPTAYGKLANREIPIFTNLLGGSSYTVTGPTSGSTGQASANFTVSLANTATFTGDQTITLSDGGAGGTFTPSVGSASSSTDTVTAATSTTSFSFSYTPASIGVKTISFTNGQSVWSNPTSLTYTAASPSSGGITTIYPGIGQVAASGITPTSAVITWSTLYAASSEIDYGTTTSYGLVQTDPNLLNFHTMTLTGLLPGTSYLYRIINTLNGVTSTFGNVGFTTLPAPAIQTPVPTTSTSTPPSSSTPVTTTPVITPNLNLTQSIFSPSSTGSQSLKLINSQGTFYLISGGQRFGITNPGILNSYGLTFKDASAPTASDLSSPLASNLSPNNGSLVKTPTDLTVYLISKGQKYGLASAQVFTSLGFKFSSVVTVTTPELNIITTSNILRDAAVAHLPGTDVNIKGTIYYIGQDSVLHPYPSLAVYNSWHLKNDFSTVIKANSWDLTLTVGTAVQMRVLGK